MHAFPTCCPPALRAPAGENFPGRTAKVKRKPPVVAVTILMMVFMIAAPAPAAAQRRLFPDVESFSYPLASPRTTGLTGRVLFLSRGESLFGDEREAEAILGQEFPLFALRRGSRPLTLGFGVHAYGRFSLDDSKSSLISTDWIVGFTVQKKLPAWDLTLQVYHESSHLGDEYAEGFNARRLDWSRAVMAGWVGYRAGPVRITGNLNRVVIDQLKLPAWGASLGVDWQGTAGQVAGVPVRPLAGVFVEGWSATDWTLSPTARLGVALPGSSGRELRFSLLAHSGLSTQRQFFREKSRYVGVEVGFVL